MLLSSPRTGPDYNQAYSQAAFENDSPRIERDDFGGQCNGLTGVGCTLLPPIDDGQPIAFYPFYSITGGSACRWTLGNDVPGLTVNDFGKTTQYGALTPTTYLLDGGHGALQTRFEVFHGNLGGNPCP